MESFLRARGLKLGAPKKLDKKLKAKAQEDAG